MWTGQDCCEPAVQCEDFPDIPALMTWMSGKTKPLIDLVLDKWMHISELMEMPWKKKKLSSPIVFTRCFPTGSGEQLSERSPSAHTALPVLQLSVMHLFASFPFQIVSCDRKVQFISLKILQPQKQRLFFRIFVKKRAIEMFCFYAAEMWSFIAALQAACAAPVPIPSSPNAIKGGRVNNWLIIALTRLLNWTRRLEIVALPGTFPLV